MSGKKNNRDNNKKNHDNDEQEFSINDLENLDLVDQWDKLIFETWDTLKDEKQYRNMKLAAFKKVIYYYEHETMKHGKVPNGFDWTKDFVKPMYQQFIDLVNIILYYFISYYLIRF